MADIFVFAILSVFLLLLFRVLFLLYQINYGNNDIILRPKTQPTSTMVVMGSGGHTTEMLRIMSTLDEKFTPRIYIVAKNDKISSEKIYQMEKNHKNKIDIIHIPRSREVLQSYFTSIFTTIIACLYSIIVVFRQLPDLVICNGPGTCIPICASAFLLRVCGIKCVRIIFIESICRVESLSLSGILLYPVCDHLIVQWKDLTTIYPKSKYLGKLV